MANRFASKLEETIPENVVAALPPGQLDAIKDNPQALIDPSARARLLKFNVSDFVHVLSYIIIV